MSSSGIIVLICTIFNCVWGTYWILKFRNEKIEDEEYFNTLKERHQIIEEGVQKIYECEDEI